MVWTIVAGVGAVILVLATSLAGVAALFTYLQRIKPPASAAGSALEARLAAVELTVMGLPSLWEDERRRSERARDASRKARDSADEKLEEVAELIESGADLRSVDGEGSEQTQLQLMRGNLGPAPDASLHERAAALEHLLR